jgi:hypothetical protein
MCSEFYRFYESAIKGPTLIIDWKTIQQQFRIKEKRFPSDKRILEYFNSNFLTNISESSRSKWHRMDKLLFIWVVVHYCDMKNRNITRVEVLSGRFREMILRNFLKYSVFHNVFSRQNGLNWPSHPSRSFLGSSTKNGFSMSL